MRANRGRKTFLDIWLATSVFAALVGVRTTDAAATSVFAICPGAESHTIFEIPREFGFSIAELSAAGSDLSRSVVERWLREPLACSFKGEAGDLNLFLGDPREAARANSYTGQAWRVTLAEDDRTLLGERSQSRKTEASMPVPLRGVGK